MKIYQLPDIPREWEIKQVRHIFEIHNGSTPKSGNPEFWNGDIDWITPDDLGSNAGKLITSSRRKITQLGYKSCGVSLAPSGSIALSTRAPIGHIAITKMAACVNQGCRILVPKEGLTEYWYYSFISSRALLISLGQGTTFMELPRQNLASVALPVPPFDEQKAIVRFLDYKTAQIDALIARKQSLLDKLAEQRTALISQAVTKGLDPSVSMKDSGVEWIGEVPAHWLLGVKLNYLSAAGKNTFVNGPFGSDLLTSELTDEGVPVVYSGDIKPGSFINKSSKFVTEQKAEQLRFCRVDPGDLLLAKVGDPPGDAAIYPESLPSGIVTQDVVRIKLDNNSADAEYLSFLLNSLYGRFVIKQVSVESTRGRFSLGDFKSLRFVLPPVEEQIAISNSLRERIRPLLLQEKKVVDVITLLQEYRAALITNAVTGKVDVRDFCIPTTTEQREVAHG